MKFQGLLEDKLHKVTQLAEESEDNSRTVAYCRRQVGTNREEDREIQGHAAGGPQAICLMQIRRLTGWKGGMSCLMNAAQ